LDEEVIRMGHTDDEVEAAASRFEKLADELDPATTEVERTEDLRSDRSRLGGGARRRGTAS
jgi:hypothetical protein